MFISRFLSAITGIKFRKRTIFDDMEDARRDAGLPPKTMYYGNRWI